MGITNMLLNLLLLSVAVFIVSKILPDIKCKSFGTAILVAVVLSVINILIGWLLRILAFPLTLLTFGLFNIVIFAVLLWITDQMVEDFEIKGFGTTLLAAVLIAVINTILVKIVF